MQSELGKEMTMVRKLTCVSAAMVAILCATAMVYGPAQAQPRRSEPQTESQAATILVEAFIVEVNLPALDKLGVSPIGRPPHAVSVENILTCLKNGQGAVVAGAKEATQDQRNSKIRATHTTYIKTAHSNYTPYEEGTTLAVQASLQSERSVEVSYSLSCRVFRTSGPRSETQDVPPDTESWEWDGDILMTPGEPVIAAANQDGERAVFLVLTAHVRAQ
jgi:hypothetical protein